MNGIVNRGTYQATGGVTPREKGLWKLNVFKRNWEENKKMLRIHCRRGK
jgi:predicted protein tyrosine phosphatase